MDLLDNILNILKLFWLRRAMSQNRYDGEWMGYERKKNCYPAILILVTDGERG
jgi:hypothetical protein